MPEPKLIPDRVSMDIASQFYRSDYRQLGLKIDGREVQNCVEFCISEGWARLYINDSRGQPKQERGKFVAVRKHGKIEPYWRQPHGDY